MVKQALLVEILQDVLGCLHHSPMCMEALRAGCRLLQATIPIGCITCIEPSTWLYSMAQLRPEASLLQATIPVGCVICIVHKARPSHHG